MEYFRVLFFLIGIDLTLTYRKLIQKRLINVNAILSLLHSKGSMLCTGYIWVVGEAECGVFSSQNPRRHIGRALAFYVGE